MLQNHILLAFTIRIAENRLSFISFFYLFSLFYFPFVLFLAPRIRVSDDIGHMAQRRF